MRNLPVLLLLPLLLLPAGHLRAEEAPAFTPTEQWYGAYMQGIKLGHARMGAQLTEFEGAAAIESYLDSTFELKLLGTSRTLLIAEREYTDPVTREFRGALIRLETGLPGMDQHTRIVREEDRLRVELLAGESVVSTEYRPWTSGTLSNWAAAESIRAELDPDAGAEITLTIFETSSLTPLEAIFTYHPLERLYFGGVETDVYRVETSIPALGMTSVGYETREGVALKITMLNGLFELRLEEEALALSPSGAPDLLALSRVDVSGEPLPSGPIGHVELKPIHAGAVRELFFVTNRQRWKDTPDGPVLLLDMLQPGQGPLVELTEADLAAAMADSFHVQSGHPRIRELAEQIVAGIPAGQQLDRAFAVTQWVFANLKKELVPTTPNAVQVLEMGKGDCGEHAVLTAALLRAAGLPAKVLYGLVYAPVYGKGFFYHAWNAVYIEGRWLEIDSALGQFPADATHVVTGEGDNPSDSLGILQLYGQLGFEVRRAVEGQRNPDFSLRPPRH